MSDADLQLQLSSADVAGFSALISDITGHGVGNMPWLAPALLFSGAQERLGLPQAGATDMLVQDYQAIDWHAALAVDAPLAAKAERSEKGPTTEYDFALGDAVSLKTALRLVPRQDLAGLKPTLFNVAQLDGAAGQAQGLTISQSQVDRYVALSGDRNPIHSDVTLARGLGLPAPIVPGLLLLATLQPFVTGALETLKCRFMAPLCVDEAYGLAITARGPGRLRGCLYAGENRALAIVDMRVST